MARKPALSKESLTALGAEKLAELVLDQVQASDGFKRRVNAALAGKTGPAAIAKLIDRRLSGLDERALSPTGTRKGHSGMFETPWTCRRPST